MPALAAPSTPSTDAINRHLLAHGLRLAANPCISPDACLDWASLRTRLAAGGGPAEGLTVHAQARFTTAAGRWQLVEEAATGDRAWLLTPAPGLTRPERVLADGIPTTTGAAFPASWANLLTLKNLVQEHDPGSTIFPTTSPALERCSLGVGARMTTLHWPAVQWAMAHLGLSMNANQNSIPRELVYDVDAMLAGRLARVPFPFIGGSVPEGHQGQSVEGMSHGAVLSGLITGFHRRRLPWGFNADHQPIGGAFDEREAVLVRGCLLATSITFDLSPELAQAAPAGATGSAIEALDQARTRALADLGGDALARVVARVRATVPAGEPTEEAVLLPLIARVMPAMRKMQRRDRLYAQARQQAFATAIGRAYVRELSIDELPGLTTPATLATMLALAQELGMQIHFVAPAFGFQKNFPFSDDRELARRVEAAMHVCRHFDASIGFHSGSGKSAANYQVVGRITGGRLEIKTSGRYTYEFGAALAASTDAQDQALWRAWWTFTRDLAAGSAFSQDATERRFAREFISHALVRAGEAPDPFATPEACRAALARLTPDPDHMFWFEYNFLYVLAEGGRAQKEALGDHGPGGYRQRARFYAVSAQTRLRFAQHVARYLIFLAEQTGLANAAVCAQARARLTQLADEQRFLADIAPRDAADAS